jgi:thymidylate synthase (FAD)
MCYSPDEADVFIGKLSENAEETERYIRMLMDLGHESVLEHVSFTFIIEDVSRALLAQLTRHRIASYSVRSQRYVGEDDFDYIIPPAITENPEAARLFDETMELCRTNYQKIAGMLTDGYLSSKGIDLQDKKAVASVKKQAYEDARFVLPNACSTQLVMTMNVRSLYNFFSQRCCNRAQWEIRELAEQILKLVSGVAPLLFSNSGPCCVSGNCPEGKMTCGKITETRQKYAWLKEKK